MTDGIEDEYLDVLFTIESDVVRFYRHQPHLTDFDVQKVYENLARYYQDRQVVLKPGFSTELYERLQPLCDLHLGIGDFNDPRLRKAVLPEPISQEEMVLFLKRQIKSIDRWTKTGGLRGYLDYISDFV